MATLKRTLEVLFVLLLAGYVVFDKLLLVVFAGYVGAFLLGIKLGEKTSRDKQKVTEEQL